MSGNVGKFSTSVETSDNFLENIHSITQPNNDGVVCVCMPYHSNIVLCVGRLKGGTKCTFYPTEAMHQRIKVRNIVVIPGV